MCSHWIHYLTVIFKGGAGPESRTQGRVGGLDREKKSCTPPISYVNVSKNGNRHTVLSCYVGNEDPATPDSQHASCSASSMG